MNSKKLNRETENLISLYEGLGYSNEEIVKHVLMTSFLPEMFPDSLPLKSFNYSEEYLNVIYDILLLIMQPNSNPIETEALKRGLKKMLEPYND